MNRIQSVLLAITWLAASNCSFAAGVGDLPRNLRRLELEVDGLKRTALIREPAQSFGSNLPIVFVFHGHGGNARQAVRSISVHQHWPQALCVFPQGLNTAVPLTDPEGRRPGWQLQPGTNNDRDLKFFDALLEKLNSEGRGATNRVYVAGHSNGGAFAYLLWFQRPDAIAAVASSGAAANFAHQLKPKPALHLAGRSDPLVKFSWQQATMNAVRRVNDCSAEGRPWADGGIEHASAKGARFVTWIHGGGHEFRPPMDELMARFFKEEFARGSGVALEPTR